jgi:hypothetical protein
MSRVINLINYLPPFLREYQEMQAIMSAENADAQYLADECLLALNNTFILDADIRGVQRFERALKITPKSTDTLDDRRLRILTKVVGDLPYTFKKLIKQLDAACGTGGYALTINHTAYSVTVILEMSATYARTQISELTAQFRKIVPANMLLDITARYNSHVGLEVYTHTDLSALSHTQIRELILSEVL